MSIHIIDDHHLGRPHIIGTYLLLGDEPALVDPGPSVTLPTLEAGLAEHGLRFDDIRAILLTHIHLDHAGATGVLVDRYPHLRVYVHQRGAPHLIAPERLLSSATRLYGDLMDVLWGPILPIPEQAITTLAGGETIRLGNRSLRVFDTPGHASHHVSYLDEESGAVFVGDVAGVHLPGTRQARPATPPPDIDLEAWASSLDTILSLAPTALLLTHFGPVSDPSAHIADFRARLAAWAETVRTGLASGADEPTQIAQLAAVADADLDPSDAELAASYRQAAAIEQSWQGLARYWRKRTA
jgi:glyoxylase-like metal-dependent hydrolase (beta-lactamase superfamily II)